MYKKRNGMYIKVKENKGMRTCVLFLFLDKSGSVTTKEGSIYDAFKNLMEKLAKQNETALDMEIKVVLITFDNNVHVFNPNNTPLPPEQVLELFERKDYKCGGGTSLANVFTELDRIFSREENGFLTQMKPGDLYPMVLYVSDYVPTDTKEDYEKAKNKLLSNRFYEKTRRLCIYLGSENRRADAAELVGSEDNVVVLESDVDTLLTPVLIGSTLLSTDSTHTNTQNETNSPVELAEQQKKRAIEGAQGAQNQKDEQLQEELKKLLGF